MVAWSIFQVSMGSTDIIYCCLVNISGFSGQHTYNIWLLVNISDLVGSTDEYGCLGKPQKIFLVVGTLRKNYFF